MIVIESHTLAWTLQGSQNGDTGMQLYVAEAAEVEAQASGLQDQFMAIPTVAGLIRNLRSTP